MVMPCWWGTWSGDKRLSKQPGCGGPQSSASRSLRVPEGLAETLCGPPCIPDSSSSGKGSLCLPLEKSLEPQRAAELGGRWPESSVFAEPWAPNSGCTADGIFLYKDQ